MRSAYLLLLCCGYIGLAASFRGSNVSQAPVRGKQWLGYWQLWANEHEDVTWWQDNVPKNCAAGCVLRKGFFRKAATYNTVEFCFVTLIPHTDPDQNDCSKGPCPVWNGKALYNEKDTAMSDSMTIANPSSSVISIADFCRFARKHPDGPKRCNIGIGGWSDWARIATAENAEHIAKLAAKLVLFTFADGIDLDFEHLAEYTRKFGDGEYEAYTHMVNSIRKEMDAITPQMWSNAIQERTTALQAHKGKAVYYREMVEYLGELAANPMPHFELIYTTRFNAFLDTAHPWNYLDPNSTHPDQPYITDNEGQRVWANASTSFDTVNVMSYDADKGMKLNYGQILDNFHTQGGVPKAIINIGFEPGNQAGEFWPGEARDLKAVSNVNANGYGGAMIWTINPDKHDNPKAYTIVPGFNKHIAAALQAPKWPWGTPPKYTPYSN